jgi:hypothetical protein
MDITSQNSSFIIAVPAVFALPQTVVAYATDDAFMTDEADIAEVMLGVDGRMSAGFMPFIVKQTVALQADSPSILNTFEAWIGAMQSTRTPYFATGTILLPSQGRQYLLQQGVLTRITPVSAAKKVMQPVKYTISWGGWTAAPMVP